MAAIASTDVTITQQASIGVPGKTWIAGRKRHGLVSIAFGNAALTYPSGGIPMPAASFFGMARNVDTLVLSDPSNASGLLWKYDHSNKTMKGYFPGPILFVEEVVTVASNTGTLAYIPAYIVGVEVTAGSVTGGFHTIPVGETPATLEVAVGLTTGVLTFFATDAVTSVRVTYIPLRTGGYFSAANRVIDEVVVASASGVNTASRAALVQYVYDDTDGARCIPEPPGEQPTATHNCVLDINNTAVTSIDSHADDAGNSLKVTYFKHAALPTGATLFVDDADITLASEAFNFHTGTGTRSFPVMPGFGTNLVGEETATHVCDALAGPSATPAAAIASWNPTANTLTTNHTTAITTTAISWLILDSFLLGEGSLIEMGTNFVVPAQTLYAQVIGW